MDKRLSLKSKSCRKPFKSLENLDLHSKLRVTKETKHYCKSCEEKLEYIKDLKKAFNDVLGVEKALRKRTVELEAHLTSAFEKIDSLEKLVTNNT